MTKGVWRVVQSYNAEADDELSLKIDQLITVLSIEENGWAEGILENQWVGWFPIECAAPDNSQLHMDVAPEKLQHMRLDNLFKNADILDGTVNKRDSLALTGLDKLKKRNAVILDFIECEAVFIKSMNAWMSTIESNSVFSLLSKGQAVSLLEAIDDVINFHQVLLGSLEVVRSADPTDQMFGGYFLDFIPFFSEVYLKLKSLLPKIVTCIIESNNSQNRDIMSVLQFSADIHMPVQHVTKTINFTRRILNVTPLDHEDWTFTMYSWRSLRDAVKKIDQEVKEIESEETLNSFLEKLDSYDGPPLHSFGQLVRYGTLRIGDRRQLSHVYLLEKKLFILRSIPLSLPIGRKYKGNSFLSGTKFTIEHQILLNSQHIKAIVTNSDMGDDFFRISYFIRDKSIRSIDCYAFNKEIMKVWVDMLNNMVTKQDAVLHEEITKSNVHAEDLYEDLMSFIENDEPQESNGAPPVPPKDDFGERLETRHVFPKDEELPVLPEDEIAYSLEQNHIDENRFEIGFEPPPTRSNLENPPSGNEDLTPADLVRENPLNAPKNSVQCETESGRISIKEEAREEIILCSNTSVRQSEESTTEQLTTDEEFLTDSEYARLLVAYEEKVAQVEALKKQLKELSMHK